MTDRELKEIREKISCPELGDEHLENESLKEPTSASAIHILAEKSIEALKEADKGFIDKNLLLKSLEYDATHSFDSGKTMRFSKLSPLTADVVKVVRCKDCKHFKPLSDGSWINQNREDGICYALVNYHDSERYCVRPDHFCSYGELKELG